MIDSVLLPYVVLHHTGYGEPHFDLMLATDASGPLLTWRCQTWPVRPGDEPSPLPPHRRDYLWYEGDVSNGRGHVRRVDEGSYRCIAKNEHEMKIEINRIPLGLPRGVNP